MEREPIRTWQEGTFTLHLYDDVPYWSKPQFRLAYEFFDSRMGAEPIFTGNDYGCSPLHAIDSDESVAGLLAFLSLKRGDTDSEYFDDYTPRQLEWRDQYAEELGIYAYELEEGANCEHD